MNRLDPFIIYTVKLVTEKKAYGSDRSKEHHRLFPTTIGRIMTIKSWSNTHCDKPKLNKDNLLSLLYHADEQWLASTKELQQTMEANITKIQRAIDRVHRQQSIFLDTLHLLRRSQKYYYEPILFAAQVLYHHCQVRYLESFTETLQPLAIKLIQSLEQVRCTIHRLLEHSTTFFSFLNKMDGSVNELIPHLDRFYTCWCEFEMSLYQSYLQIVFGHHHIIQKSVATTFHKKRPMPVDLLNDRFVQLLPLTLERAIEQRIIDIQSITSFEPLAFVALPRLAILAGVTWLSHLTKWRAKPTLLPIWIRRHAIILQRIVCALDELEMNLLLNSSKEQDHVLFVEKYQALEEALVSGNNHLDGEKQLYLNICFIADSILSSSHAQSFSNVLGHLFRCFGNEEQVVNSESDMPFEQAILDLAI
ncbi:hypothetical protein G6F57_002474 [Rhizopus arrhizus]|uniref:Uncharacterized protein n=1 Tax=Rhizopus oryzae TaxID=64495 RepID=A0A9P6XKH0_RHIOR|nr:hypothetical protein G6F24_004151 [Rhizopus arrhizus]KAG1427728.1 hypothetical protein G6F58_000897 [Rhizopus delemar]KAG0795847.1 hypothetical protein G6F21_001774 [Rhizopus arrhizus]KAG0815709.1 hypothetical protein G6F20_003786 [Rhizopus arrhizus]KAG0838097.1 hypothetical protein G6F19_003335 [Rhizopus arrhizus]